MVSAGQLGITLAFSIWKKSRIWNQETVTIRPTFCKMQIALASVLWICIYLDAIPWDPPWDPPRDPLGYPPGNPPGNPPRDPPWSFTLRRLWYSLYNFSILHAVQLCQYLLTNRNIKYENIACFFFVQHNIESEREFYSMKGVFLVSLGIPPLAF